MNSVNPAIYEYTLPACWASYLINGDSSGLDAEEKLACDTFLEENKLVRHWFTDCTEQFFSSRCDAGQLPGDKAMFTYMTHA